QAREPDSDLDQRFRGVMGSHRLERTAERDQHRRDRERTGEHAHGASVVVVGASVVGGGDVVVLVVGGGDEVDGGAGDVVVDVGVAVDDDASRGSILIVASNSLT